MTREHTPNEVFDAMELIIKLMKDIRAEPNAAIRKFYHNGLVRLSEELGLKDVPSLEVFLGTQPTGG